MNKLRANNLRAKTKNGAKEKISKAKRFRGYFWMKMKQEIAIVFRY
jgi:hypothetical protein